MARTWRMGVLPSSTAFGSMSGNNGVDGISLPLTQSWIAEHCDQDEGCANAEGHNNQALRDPAS